MVDENNRETPADIAAKLTKRHVIPLKRPSDADTDVHLHDETVVEWRQSGRKGDANPSSVPTSASGMNFQNISPVIWTEVDWQRFVEQGGVDYNSTRYGHRAAELMDAQHQFWGILVGTVFGFIAAAPLAYFLTMGSVLVSVPLYCVLLAVAIAAARGIQLWIDKRRDKMWTQPCDLSTLIGFCVGFMGGASVAVLWLSITMA